MDLQQIITFLGGIGGTIVLLIPGYVLSKVYSRGVRGPELSDQAFVASTAIGGVVTHVLMLWWTLPLLETLVLRVGAGQSFRDLYLEIAAWTLAVLILVPALLGGVFSRFSDARWGPAHRVLSFLGLSTEKRTTEAWNWIFGELNRRGEGQWLKVRLKNGGGTYLGAFGPNSLVSSDANVRDVYLEVTWDLDDTGEPVPDNVENTGVWIAGDQILAIEFYPSG